MAAPFIPHTDDDIASMLEFLGLDTVEDLFDLVPEAVRLSRDLILEPAGTEADVWAELSGLAAANKSLISFAGAGAYDHDLAAAVRSVGGRSEFLTAYTPYQPEMAQGILQALFEFQTLISRLTSLPVSNASLYDGATACVEAVNIAVTVTGRKTVWLSGGLHPQWRETVRTFAAGTGHDIVTVPLEGAETQWPNDAIDRTEAPACIVVQYPNVLGCLENIGAAVAMAHARGALVVMAFDPLAASVLKPPGEWGIDIAVGEGQAFSAGLSFGGPYLGLFACSEALTRRAPGRLVGETIDADGARAYVTTLRTREQDIRREKASSNICTNQTLLAVVATMQLSWLGPTGLQEMAKRCVSATHGLADGLLDLPGVSLYAQAPFVRDVAVRLPISSDVAIDRLIDYGFLAGYPLSEDVLVCSATERRTEPEIIQFVAAVGEVIA